MYPSDYGYAAGTTCVTGTKLFDYGGGCRIKDWLYISNTFQWPMSPRSGNSDGVFGVFSSGGVSQTFASFSERSVRPVFYLTPSASITSGTGTLTDPYILG